MGAINANAFYGAVRGMEDSRLQANNQASFDQDQAIRKEALDQSRAQAPLRTQALQLGVQEGQARMADQAAEGPLRRRALTSAAESGELTVAEQKLQAEALKIGRERQRVVARAVDEFHATRDPNALVKANAQLFPGAGLENWTAVRGEGGSITIKDQQGQVMKEFKAGTSTPSGQPYDADLAASQWIMEKEDPVKFAKAALEFQRKHEGKLDELRVVQGGREAVARIGAVSRENVAATGAAAGATKRTDAEIKTESGKINGILSARIGAKNSFTGLLTDDAQNELRGKMATQADDAIRNSGLKAQEAVDQAHNDVEKAYDIAKSAAEEAAKAGDQAKLTKVLDATERRLGYSVRKHLQSKLPVQKKK